MNVKNIINEIFPSKMDKVLWVGNSLTWSIVVATIGISVFLSTLGIISIADGFVRISKDTKNIKEVKL